MISTNEKCDVFERSMLILIKAAFINQKYSKKSNLEKYYYNLK